ncbi:MAG: hypothetical protein E6987_00385 [Peptoniphilus harei]|nr:hypothetical protein [Peptoniphilus harei]
MEEPNVQQKNLRRVISPRIKSANKQANPTKLHISDNDFVNKLNKYNSSELLSFI